MHGKPCALSVWRGLLGGHGGPQCAENTTAAKQNSGRAHEPPSPRTRGAERRGVGRTGCPYHTLLPTVWDIDTAENSPD